MSLALTSRKAALLAPWLRNPLWAAARAVPSLDLRFAEDKSLVDATTGQNLVTFTRASGGTYVDSQGVIRTATTNLLLRSEEFDNASWTKFGCSIGGAQVVAPTGVNTADEIVEDTSTANHYTTQSVASIGGFVYTYSVFVKAVTRSFCFLVANAAGTLHGVSINLSTGAASSAVGSPSSIASVSAGNGWYRVSFTYTSGTTGSVGHEVRLSTDGVWANRSYTGDGTSGIYIWGAQLEQSSTVGEYVPTGATINSAPRFDHNPTTGESLGLLVEEQRTNSIRNNTMVGAVAGTPGTLPTNWSLSQNAALTQQVVGSGTSNGAAYFDIRFSGTSSGNAININLDTVTSIAAANGQSWTFSSYLALVGGSASNVTGIRLRAAVYSSTPTYLGELVATPTNLTGSLSSVLTRQAATTGTISNASTAYVQPYIAITVGVGVAIDITLRIGMPQLEQGAFATSVIPTTGTAATRSADVASISGSNFSSWYRQDEGTMFADCDNARPVSGGNQFAFRASDGTYTNNVVLNIQSSGLASLSTAAAGVFDGIATTATGFSANVQSRMAGAYKSNDLACCFAGGALATDATVTIPTALTRADIGSDHAGLNRFGSGHIRRLTYWGQRLGNEVLQRLTQ